MMIRLFRLFEVIPGRLVLLGHRERTFTDNVTDAAMAGSSPLALYIFLGQCTHSLYKHSRSRRVSRSGVSKSHNTMRP